MFFQFNITNFRFKAVDSISILYAPITELIKNLKSFLAKQLYLSSTPLLVIQYFFVHNTSAYYLLSITCIVAGKQFFVLLLQKWIFRRNSPNIWEYFLMQKSFILCSCARTADLFIKKVFD